MMQFNVVVFGQSGERGYFCNNVRFNRDQWRKIVEFEIESTKRALVFQTAQVEQLEYALAAAQSLKDGKAAFPLPPDHKEIYRQVIREIREDLTEAKYVLEQGQSLIADLEEMLED